MNASTVWAEDSSGHTTKSRIPGVRPLVIVAVAVAVAALGAALWAYFTGLQISQSLAAQLTGVTDPGHAQTINQFVAQTKGWAFQLVIAAIAGGGGLLLVAVMGGRWLAKSWMKQHAVIYQRAEARSQQLLSQLADIKVQEEEARKMQGGLQSRLTDVSTSHALLQRELDERRQAEKSLNAQRQSLERSKDVLELHVQARTQELQKLQRRNELILNSAGEGICGFDLQGRATFVNPAAAKMTGWKIDDMIGKSEAEIFFAAKPGAKNGALLAKGEKGEPLGEQKFQRKDGSGFTVEYLRTPIQEQNKVMGAVVMFKDITERRLADDKLGHKAAELARSNAELEQFAYAASHDLQEPLRKIQAFGDRLKIKCEAVQLEEGRDYLERMQSAAARMQTLINDLLTFSRVIRSSQPFVQVDLQVVAREVLGDLEHRMEKSKAQVELGELPFIEADPSQMRQLLQNLISNALKFQTPGAIPIVKVKGRLVTRDQIREDAIFPNPPPTVSPDDKLCLLTVSDNGIGFEEQFLEKIFAVFQRLHGRSEYEGTGVGLAVCRRITDRHGGLITAQSKPGEGATFVVLLPVRQPEQKEPQ